MSKKEYIPAAVKAAVFAAHDCCAACGTWDATECGHIIAEANGGAVSAENMIRLCGACNRAQGTATVSIKAIATYTESRALVETRRAMWAKYCSFAKATKTKPYVALPA